MSMRRVLAGAIEGVHRTRVNRAGLLPALDARSDRNPLPR